MAAMTQFNCHVAISKLAGYSPFVERMWSYARLCMNIMIPRDPIMFSLCKEEFYLIICEQLAI